LRGKADAAAHAVAHPTRVDILTVLHDGPASAKELSEMLCEPLSNVTHHLNELKVASAIEVAFTKEVGNVNQHYWRPMRTATFYREDFEKISQADHEAFRRIVSQSIMAELLSALRAGQLTDPYTATAWDRLWLDEQGYQDLSDFTDVYFQHMYEIAAESAERVIRTGEDRKMYISAVLAFRRGLPRANIKATVGHLGQESPPGR
jgi:DNA-binding transcriptional ArsR family regulator